MESVVIRPRAAAKYIGVGISTFWRFAKNDPTFPKPFKIGPQATVINARRLGRMAAAKAGGQIKMATPSLKQPTSHVNYTRKPDCFNVFQSINDTAPSWSMDFDDLVKMAANPLDFPEKKACPLIVPFVGRGKRKPDAERALFSSIVVDHDRDNLSRAGVLFLYRNLEIECLLAFTTWSSKPTDMRRKVVIPLSNPIR